MTQFLGMNRLQNSKKVTRWAVVESLSQLSRGLQRVATAQSVISRHSLTHSTVFRKLNKCTPMVQKSTDNCCRENQISARHLTTFSCLLVKKYQINAASSDSMYATCRLAKCSFPVLPAVGSVLICENLKFLVIKVLHRVTYASLLRIQSLLHGTINPLP